MNKKIAILILVSPIGILLVVLGVYGLQAALDWLLNLPSYVKIFLIANFPGAGLKASIVTGILALKLNPWFVFWIACLSTSIGTPIFVLFFEKYQQRWFRRSFDRLQTRIARKNTDLRILMSEVLTYILLVLTLSDKLYFFAGAFLVMEILFLVFGFYKEFPKLKTNRKWQKILIPLKIVLFIICPIPGSGVWSGYVFAKLNGYSFKKALPYLYMGMLIGAFMVLRIVIIFSPL